MSRKKSLKKVIPGAKNIDRTKKYVLLRGGLDFGEVCRWSHESEREEEGVG